jgi:hypothetical protein
MKFLPLIFATGCMVGGSTSMVGRYGARRIVDSTACLQSQAPGGGCQKVVTIGREVPPRKFDSLSFTFVSSGYMQQRGGDDVGHGLALSSHFEYVRGRGGFAIGGRIGGNVASGFSNDTGRKLYFLVPVSVVAHLGDYWGSIYAGAGYSPVALEQQYVHGTEMVLPAEYHYNSVHAFVGTRFWLKRTLERGFSFSPELRVDRFGDSTLFSMTGNIGIHF